MSNVQLICNLSLSNIYSVILLSNEIDNLTKTNKRIKYHTYHSYSLIIQYQPSTKDSILILEGLYLRWYLWMMVSHTSFLQS